MAPPLLCFKGGGMRCRSRPTRNSSVTEGLSFWDVEAVQFQEFFRQVLVAESAKRKILVPARGIENTTDKDLRIESRQPHCNNGLILFNRNHKTLIAQLEQCPDADHGDGPDALKMVWWNR
jgi:predicted phage terminase large subunit-like protein